MYTVYYTASWCVPCRTFRPAATSEIEGRGLKMIAIDVDEYAEGARFDNVMSVPTVIMFDDQGAELDRVVGASLPTLKKTLDKLEAR